MTFKRSFLIVDHFERVAREVEPVRESFEETTRKRGFDSAPLEAVNAFESTDNFYDLEPAEGEEPILFCRCGYSGAPIVLDGYRYNTINNDIQERAIHYNIPECVIANDIPEQATDSEDQALDHLKLGYVKEKENTSDGFSSDHHYGPVDRKQWHEYRLIYGCPECGSRPDHHASRLSGSHIFTEHIELFDDREEQQKIALSACMTTYYFNHKVNKLAVSTYRLRFMHNFKTRQTYFVDQKRPRSFRNITQGIFAPTYFHLLRHLSSHTDDFFQFAGMICEAHLPYRTLDSFMVFPNDFDGFIEVLRYASYPELQSLPFEKVGFLPKKMRRQIRQAGPSAKALLPLFFGRRVNKRIVSLFHNYRYMKAFRLLDTLFQNDDVILRFIDTLYAARKHKYGGPIDIIKQLFRHLSSDAIFDRNDTGEKHLHDAFRWFRSLHQDGTHVCRALERTMGKRNLSVVHELFYLMTDTYDTYGLIREQKPEFEYRYRGDLVETHDYLAREYARLGQPFALIPYSKEEQDVYNRVVDDHTFTLAKSNHELIDIGHELVICVGSYGPRAMKKALDIVTVTNPEGELWLCIEVRPNGEMQQAKKYRNNMDEPLTEQETELIVNWASLTGTKVNRCYDIEFNRGVDFDQHLRVENPEWYRHSEEVVGHSVEDDVEPLIDIPFPVPFGV